ncbi:MAG: endonuclease domain-containing protein [Pirellulaceae bacterium]
MRKLPPSTACERRRDLRRTSTSAESLFWSAVRNRRLAGLKFRRQHSVGCFIVDFYCHEKRIVVELDGGYHDHVVDADRKRQRQIEAEGITVVRFSNEEVLENLEGVLVAVLKHVGLYNPTSNGDALTAAERLEKLSKFGLERLIREAGRGEATGGT